MRKQISKRGPFSLSLHFGINQPSLNPFLGEERRKSSVGGRNLFPSFSISRWMDGILLRMKRLQCDWRRQWPGVNWRRNVVRTKSEQSRLKRKKDVGDEREKRASNLPNLYFSSAYISIVFVSLSVDLLLNNAVSSVLLSTTNNPRKKLFSSSSSPFQFRLLWNWKSPALLTPLFPCVCVLPSSFFLFSMVQSGGKSKQWHRTHTHNILCSIEDSK